MPGKNPSDSVFEYVVAGSFGAALVGAVGFAAAYWTDAGLFVQGAAATVALAAFALGLAVWANTTLEGSESTEARPRWGSTPEERDAVRAGFESGEKRVVRRRLLAGIAGSSVAAAVLAAIFPFRSLGPRPGDDLERTAWGHGVRLVDTDGNPVRPEDLDVDTALVAYPEAATDEASRAASQIMLIDLGPAANASSQPRPEWMVQGCIAYSRVCTHAGCPVGVYEADTHRLMCPCHQSLFDVLDGAKPRFGPASRPLPQLPLALNDAGEFISTADFDEPVGPGFWNR